MAQKITIRVRREVAQFALLMEQKLQAHDAERGHRGWKNARMDHLAIMGHSQGAKLFVALQDYPMSSPDMIADKAADVANLAMMVTDNAGALPKLPTK